MYQSIKDTRGTDEERLKFLKEKLGMSFSSSFKNYVKKNILNIKK